MSNKNNKSSNCIAPGSFNPLINYKTDEKPKRKMRRIFYKNQDHFNNMTPTQIYTYRPHIKQSKYNHYLISQIDSLPGSRPPLLAKNLIKKSGKKTFKNMNLFEESKENFIYKNNNKLKKGNISNINNNRSKFSQVYEFDNPVISHLDVCNKDNPNKKISF